MGPKLPLLLQTTGYGIKGTATTYNNLMQYDLLILQTISEKWSKELNEDIPIETIELGFKTLKKSQESAYTRYIQFKVLQSQVMTNKILFQMGLKDSDKCPRCREFAEDICKMYNSF